jgi:hypothetical protein
VKRYRFTRETYHRQVTCQGSSYVWKILAHFFALVGGGGYHSYPPTSFEGEIWQEKREREGERFERKIRKIWLEGVKHTQKGQTWTLSWLMRSIFLNGGGRGSSC